jgi:chromatin structure-remodeling complex subunit RSC1/2
MTQQQRYEAKPDPDVYYLPDSANNSIPEDVRRQFQCDAYGRLLFFTAPPIDVEKKVEKLGHTAKYLAWKVERENMLKEKRKRVASATPQRVKRARSEEIEGDMVHAEREVLTQLNDLLAEGTVAEYQAVFGDKWREAMEKDLGALEKGQDRVEKARRERITSELKRLAVEKKGLEIRGLSGSLEFGVRT